MRADYRCMGRINGLLKEELRKQEALAVVDTARAQQAVRSTLYQTSRWIDCRRMIVA